MFSAPKLIVFITRILAVWYGSVDERAPSRAIEPPPLRRRAGRQCRRLGALRRMRSLCLSRARAIAAGPIARRRVDPFQIASWEPASSFQSLILDLQRYWAAQGCVILQPYDIEVGAGTFHPATALRALGPEPWRAAYVQPSRRPTDGRYGENPNRLQHYYQFQVILKPSPADIQDLYLSLAAIGIDAASMTSALSKMIGRARPWAPGGSAGRSGSMVWKSPSSPISSRSAGSNATRSRPS